MTGEESGSAFFRPGERFGRFEVRRELGRGGFARVYLAKDTVLGRPVALKVMNPGGGALQDAARDSFLEEARVVASLAGGNVVTLYQAHERPDGTWVLEMEYVDGGSLRDLLGEGQRLPPNRARAIFTDILRGLASAHEKGVLHRDIKPANVMLAADGSAKLADFGLAQALEEESVRTEPAARVAGTPWYMSPEALRGERAGIQADLWSVGVVAYEMLTGSVPFPSKDLASLFFAIQNAPCPALPDDVPADLTRAISLCLLKRREDRPATCADVLAALGEAGPTREPGAESHGVGLSGRDDALKRVREVLQQAAEGAQRTILVTGETGIGKTALLGEIEHEGARLGFHCWGVRADPSTSLARTLLRALADRFEPPDHDPAAWDAVFSDARYGPVAPLLRQIVPRRGAAGDFADDQVDHAVECLLSTATGDGPVCVWIDDAQHAVESQLPKLSRLFARIADRPLVLVLAARTGESESLPGALDGAFPDALRIELEGLSPEATLRFLESEVGGLRIAPRVASRIAGHSEGNPLVAAELLRHLRERNLLVIADDRLEPAPGWDRATVPHRLSDIVERRLAGLDDEDRSLLEVAAVDGRDFDGHALAAVFGAPLLATLRRLQGLCRHKNLIAPSEGGYRFVSPVMQRVVYESTAPELRTELHRELAAHLESRGDGVPAGRVARHLARSGQEARARPYFVVAGEQATARGDTRRFLEYAERAGLTRPELTPAEALMAARLCLRTARTLIERGRFADSFTLLDALEQGARDTGDEQLLLEAGVVRAEAQLRSQGLSATIVETLETAAGKLEDPRARCRAQYRLGIIAKSQGKLDDAERALEEACRVAREGGVERMRAAALDQLGSVARRGRDFERAEVYYAESAEISTAIGRRGSAAASEVNRASAAFGRGVIDGLVPDLERAIGTLAMLGHPRNAAFARVMLSEIRFAGGDLGGALGDVEMALPGIREVGQLYGVAAARSHQGHLLSVSGRLERAEEALGEATAAAESAGDQGLLAICHAYNAQAALFAADTARADEAINAVVTLAATAGPQIAPALDATLEVALYGAEQRTIDAVLDVVDGCEGVPPHILDLASAIRTLLATDVPTGPLRRAAESLRDPRVGTRRATWRIVADVLAAEGYRREGDPVRARSSLADALRAARALGHVWLEVVVLERLRGLDGSPHAAEQLAGVIARVTRGLTSDDVRSRVAAAWNPA